MTPHSSYEQLIPDTVEAFPMVAVPAGEFLMGSPETEIGHQQDEAPQRLIQVDAFWMQARPVTWNEYQLFQFAATSALQPHDDAHGVTHPSKPYLDLTFGMGAQNFPALSMTQHAASKYAQWLSLRTGHFYRLPTEAEWEYACRAGSPTAYFFGDNPQALTDYAWFAGNSGGRTHPVAQKLPNPWGLYDMLGNVREWTLDAYAPYAPNPARNPYVRPDAPYPMTVRGGSWADPAPQLRCAARLGSHPAWKRQDPQYPKSIWHHTDAPWLGFRLVRPLVPPDESGQLRFWNNGVAYDE